MTALATLTLGSAQSTVTFSSIPATYRDLRLVIVADMTSGAEQMRMRLNSDSTYSNYSGVGMAGTGSSALSATWSGSAGYGEGSRIQYQAFQQASTSAVQTEINILDYSATDKHKTTLVRASKPAGGVDAIASRWASTSAVTSILLDMFSGSFTAGSTFSLYGIAS
jgi:hypothetical protein